MKHYSLLSCWLLLSFLWMSCKTTEPIRSVNSERQEALLYSSYDPNSSVSSGYKGLDSLVKATEERVNSNPNEIDAILNLAQMYLLQNRIADAELLAKRALAIDFKNIAAKKVLATTTFKKGQHDLAEVLLLNLGGENSNDSEVLNLLGLISLEKKDPTKAIYYLKKGLEINAEDSAIRMNLGGMYLEYRQLHLAAAQFERVLKSMPQHIDAKINLGIVKMARGEAEAAETDFGEVLKSDDKNLPALYNYASVLYQLQKYKDSESVLKKYIALLPENSQQMQMAFALADKLQQVQGSESGISSEEIKSLSDRMATSETTSTKRVVQKDAPKAQVVREEVKPTTMEKAKVNTNSEKNPVQKVYQDENIEDLERALK